MDSYDNELDKLDELYRRAGTEAQKLAAPLLNEAVFQSNQLESLRKTIEREGWTTVYNHGAMQHGTTTSVAGKTYLTLIKCFNTTIKTLWSILDDKMPEPASELQTFMRKKRETR